MDHLILRHLPDIEVGKRKQKINRASPGELFRAYCEDCGWTGPWRSVWNKWETLVNEVGADLDTHNLEAHPTLVIT